MNNNLSPQILSNKSEDELFEMIQESIDYRNNNPEDEDTIHEALEQIEAVTYVLKNCDLS